MLREGSIKSGLESKPETFVELGLQLLFNNVDVLLWTVREDREGKVFYERVNPAFAELRGRTTDYFNGKPIDEVSTPEETELIRKSLAWAKLGKLHNYEQEVGAAGERKHLLVRVIPLVEENGAIHSFVASAVDITGRKLVEREFTRHMRIIKALYDLARELSSSPDENAILERSATLLEDNPNVKAGALYTVEQASSDFILKRAFGVKRGFYEYLGNLTSSDPEFEDVVNAPGLVIYKDFGGRREAFGKGRGIKVSVAMRSGNEVQGMISMLLANDVVDSYTKGFLETVASELGRNVKRKRTEDALRESEERYRLFTEEAFVGVYIFLDDRFWFVNPQMTKITGYSQEELLTMEPWKMVAKGEKERIAEIHALTKTQSPFHYTMRIIRKSGDEAVLEIKTRGIPYEGKTAFLGNCIDITERIRSEEKEREYLRNLEFISRTAMGFVEIAPEDDIYLYIGERLLELIGGAFVTVSSFNPDTDELTVRALRGAKKIIKVALNALGRELVGSSFMINEAGREGLTSGRLERVEGGLYELSFHQMPKVLCKSIEELLGLGEIYAIGFSRQKELFGSASLILPRGVGLADRGVIETFVKQASVALQRRLAEEALHRSHDELELRVQERTAELAAANMVLKNEIADRLKIEEALRESEERYRKVNESIQDMIFSLSPQGEVLFISGACEKIFGIPPQVLIGRNIFEAAAQISVSQEWVEEAVRTYAESLEQGKENLQYDLAVERNGERRFLEINERVVYDMEGKVVNSYGVVRDITERKKAQDALRESEERYRAFTEEALVGVYIYDKKGRLLFVNPAMQEITGYSRQELLFMNTKQLEVPEHFKTDEIREEIRQQEDPDIHRYFMHLVRKDGEIAVLEFQTRSILYQGKEAVLGNCIDITERRQSEVALRESEEKHRVLLASIRAPVLALNRDMEILYCNKAYEEYVGKPSSELVGRKFLELFPEFEGTKSYEAYLETMQTGESEEVEGWDNDQYMRVRVYRTPTGILAIAVNITEQKRAEEALRESEEKYRTIVERSNDGIAIIQEGRITYVNHRLAELGDYSVEEIINTPFADYIHPGELPKVNLLYQRRMAGEQVPSMYETAFKDKDGKRIEVEINVSIITYQGNPAEFVFVRDIRERKHAEEALRESEEKFRSLAEESPNMIFIHGRGKVLYANKKSLELMGYSREEFYSPDFDFRTLIAPESGVLVNQAFELHGEGKDIPSYEYNLVTKDGRRLDSIIATKLISYEGVNAILGIVTDISERKRMEEELRKAHDELEVRVRERTRELADTNVELLSEISDRKRAEESLDKERQAFAIIAEAAVGAEAIPQLCYKVLKGLVETLGFNMGFIQLYDPKRRILKRSAEIGEEECRPVEEDERPQSIDNPNYIGTYVARSGNAIFAPDVRAHDIYRKYSQRLETNKVGALISWPVFGTSGKLMGVMQLINDEPKNLAEENRIFFETVAGMFAVVLERKMADEALRESEERYRILTEEAMVGVYVSQGSKFLFVNPAMENITGYTRQELLTIDSHELILSEDVQMIEERKKRRRPGEGDQYSFRIRRKGGSLSTIEVRTRPLNYIGEAVYLGNCVDVTELIRQRRQIEQSKRAWEFTFDSIVDLVMILDPEERIMRANRAVTDYVGKEFEALQGRNYRDVFHLENTSSEKVAASSRRSKLPEHFEITDPQTGKVFSISVSPLLDQLGEPVAIVHVARDISNMRHVEQALATSEAQFRALAESARDIIFSVDHEQRISYVNPAAKEILGIDPAAAQGLDAFELLDSMKLPPGTKEKLFDKLRTRGDEETIPFFEVELYDETGREHVMEISARLLVNQVVGIARDITERKRMQNQLIQTSKLASLGTLAAGIAHQVNNPLAIMLSTSTVLHDLVSDEKNIPEGFREEVSRYLDMMETQVERTKSVVTALLEFTQPKQFEMQAVNLNSVIKEALGFISQHLSMEKIKLEVSLDPRMPEVLADPVSLEQVLINVIQNAYDALQGVGSISVSTRVKAGRIRILVRDDGPGVPPEIRKDIFEPLYTTKLSKGTGLGLPVSIMLLERFSGRIYLDDTQDIGAAFVIELPLPIKEKDDN